MGGRLNQARHSTLQEVQHSPVEGFRLLDVAEVPGGGDEHELGRIGNPTAFFAPPLDRTPLATPRWQRDGCGPSGCRSQWDAAWPGQVDQNRLGWRLNSSLVRGTRDGRL